MEQYGTWEDVQNESRGASTWCRLKTGEKVRVVLMLDPGDKDLGVVFFKRHKWNGETYPLCTRKRGEPVDACELCKADDPVQWRMRVTVWNIDAGRKQRLDGFPAMWYEDMKEACQYADPASTVFVISRKGEKAQTRRPIIAAGAIPEDALKLIALTTPYSKAELLPELGGGFVDDGTAGGPGDDVPPPDDDPFQT